MSALRSEPTSEHNACAWKVRTGGIHCTTIRFLGVKASEAEDGLAGSEVHRDISISSSGESRQGSPSPIASADDTCSEDWLAVVDGKADNSIV